MTGTVSRDGNTSKFSSFVRAGDLVFVSGQASVDENGSIVPGTFAEEMRRSFANIIRVLADAGLELSDVVKVGAYLRDAGDLPEFNRLYTEYFTDPLPARTTITGCLPESIRFEVDVVAHAGDR
ncbi:MULTISPECIES: RidA family protein [Amycolatopsis]|uniref:RidA family protein n=1 Tax=Amycolatopsis thermalba TaxID=944492 RepID=A0ABY4NQQ7_9PSEU|nr:MULTISPECIES: RidA family protein [Amycolatopsis]OXM74161.1 reactive intermediate/imine deaminase [Amycolatopsis sp. KNN50.9b]UQS22114.1 RidA family protein [Amycolatopsis thermalba]